MFEAIRERIANVQCDADAGEIDPKEATELASELEQILHFERLNKIIPGSHDVPLVDRIEIYVSLLRNTLIRIGEFATIDECNPPAKEQAEAVGLDLNEFIEMGYENLIWLARAVIDQTPIGEANAES